MENLPIETKFCGESIGPDNVRTVFAGEEDFGQTSKTGSEQKSIILIGSQESGKSEIIDAFCNIFYGITFDSPIRYKIANERFDSSITDISIVKYVFYGTKFSYIPVIIDIPDIQSQSLTYSLVQQFLNHDTNAQIHALAIILPGNLPSFNPQIQIEFSKLLSLFSSTLKDSSLSITNNIESETNSSNTLLQQIKLIPFKRFYTNTSSIFIKPSLDATIRERQMRYFDLTVQNLSLLIFHLGVLSPQAIWNPSINLQQRPASALENPRPPSGLPPRPRPASAAQNRIPTTIHENVSIASTSTSSKSDIPVIQLRSSSRKLERPAGVVVEGSKVSYVHHQQGTRPSSFQETEDKIQITKSKVIKDQIYSSEQALAPPSRSVIYGSQPIGSGMVIPEIKHQHHPGEDPSTYVLQNKRYLYDPETRTYQMYFVHEKYASQTLPPAAISSSTSPIPRVISPAHGVRKNEVREEMARLIRGSVEDIEATPTESSEQSSGILQRGGIESARSTSSDWKYTPSHRGTIDKQHLQHLQHQQGSATFISGSPEPPLIKHALTIPDAVPPNVRGFSYADPRMSWKQAPPKPARAVDPEFGKSEEEGAEGFQRVVQMRQTRRQPSSQRRAIKSHPQQGSEQYSGYPEWDDTDDVEYAENVPLRKFQPNQEIYQQKVPIKQGWGQQVNTKRFSYPPPLQQQQQPRNPYQQIPGRRPSNNKRPRGGGPQQPPPPGYRRRQKQITFEMEEDGSGRSSSSSGFDCTKCCFYILAPIFIISAIIAVVVTLILSAR
uniref:RNA polymerase II-associated factor 1 homolog n=1 Tax=Panagrolaimus sp. ES5 TaxID=591445 RepID=A0AC34FNM2_9BILA